MTRKRSAKTKPEILSKIKPKPIRNDIVFYEEFKPRTKNQSNYIRSMSETDVVICLGVAGTGKTSCAIAYGLQLLARNDVERIVIARPIVEATANSNKGKIGSLPGDVNEKIAPYLRPILEESKKYIGKAMTDRLVHEERIELCPVELMRGRTFENSFIILDEMQNCTYEQLLMVFTRIGLSSKLVIVGDIGQSDLPEKDKPDFYRILSALDRVSGLTICELDGTDIQRHPVIKEIIGSLQEEFNGKEKR